jgi:hypothetical protein
MLVGIELIHMIRKGQFVIDGVEAMSFADQFFSQEWSARNKQDSVRPRKFPRLNQQRHRTADPD